MGERTKSDVDVQDRNNDGGDGLHRGSDRVSDIYPLRNLSCGGRRTPTAAALNADRPASPEEWYSPANRPDYQSLYCVASNLGLAHTGARSDVHPCNAGPIVFTSLAREDGP